MELGHTAPAGMESAPCVIQARHLEPNPVPGALEAEAYDRMVRRNPALLNRPFVSLVSRSGLRRGRILDLGSGPGWVPIALAHRHPDWEIWALDASEEMLALARRHAVEAGVAQRIRFVHGDAAAPPFERGAFDLVCSQYTLHHLPRAETFFDSSARMARGGGRIVIKDFLRPPAWKMALLCGAVRYLSPDSEAQQEMYRDSLRAALSRRELLAALQNSSLSMARVRSFLGLEFVLTA